MERNRAALLTVALAAFGFFVWLGRYVTHRAEPAIFIEWERQLLNHSTLVAWWLTWACYIYVLVPLAMILLVVAWRVPAWRGRILFSIAMLLICWQAADLAQHLFGRPRRLDWVVRHETAFSYPSSHAAIAFGFYGLWAVMLYVSELPRAVRLAGSLALAALSLGTCWSRLALGAHYLTDLLGGALLAVAIVAAGVSVTEVLKVVWAPAGRV